MKTTDQKPSTFRLAKVNPQAMAHYKQMRAQVMPAPGVHEATCEIVLAMQLALRGHEIPFKIHAMRAMAQGVTLSQLEGLLMAGRGGDDDRLRSRASTGLAARSARGGQAVGTGCLNFLRRITRPRPECRARLARPARAAGCG